MSEKKPFHERIAEQLIDQLKKGTAPWQRPWHAGETFLPYNPITKKRYKGINTIQLMMQGYSDARWLTYNQAKSAGWQVRKNERATSVQYWKLSEQQDVTDSNGKPVLTRDGKRLQIEVELERPKVFFASVFNGAQIEGIPEITPAPTHIWNNIERAEKILAQSGANIRHGEQMAVYFPASDIIHLPDKVRFKTADGYYATALHELGHWTGHESRLNRDIKHPFLSEGYAKEELRAEIFSMILGQELQIGHDPSQHVAYVQSWIKIIQDDVFEVFRAASDAEKMQHYVLSLSQQQTQETTLTQETNMTVAQLETNVEAAEKTYIKVPFQEKDVVKELGARWDRKRQSWYIPAEISNHAPFAKWLAEEGAELPEVAPEQNNRVYLAVPFKEKANARRAGALWDKVAKSWYAGPDADMSQLNRYLPKNKRQHQNPAMPPQEEFAEVMRGLGLIVTSPHPVMDGQKHRVAAVGDKKGELAGFYVGHLDGHPAGYVKNNRTSQELKWKSKGYHLGEKQKETFRKDAEAKRAARIRAREQVEEAAAKRCQEKIADLRPVIAATPYLLAKQIPVVAGIYTNAKAEETYVPAYDENGKIWSIQYIRADGTKRFAKNARKEGCFHVVGGLSSLNNTPTIIIAEGYATASSISMALRVPVVAAFDSGNLTHVAKALRARFPDKQIVIAGDDDRHLKATQGFNPGRLKAEEAAKAVGGQCVFPRFSKKEIAENSKAFTDFNDLAIKSIFGVQGIEYQIGQMVEERHPLKTQQAKHIVSR